MDFRWQQIMFIVCEFHAKDVRKCSFIIYLMFIVISCLLTDFFFTQWVCIYSFLSEKNSKMSLKKFKRKLKYWVFVFYLKLLMHFYHELLVVLSFILCWKADGTILISSCWKCWQLTRYWLLITTEKWTCIWNGSDIPAQMIAWPYFGADL